MAKKKGTKHIKKKRGKKWTRKKKSVKTKIRGGRIKMGYNLRLMPRLERIAQLLKKKH